MEVLNHICISQEPKKQLKIDRDAMKMNEMIRYEIVGGGGCKLRNLVFVDVSLKRDSDSL